MGMHRAHLRIDLFSSRRPSVCHAHMHSNPLADPTSEEVDTVMNDPPPVNIAPFEAAITHIPPSPRQLPLFGAASSFWRFLLL